jgi:proline dehydrogenase
MKKDFEHDFMQQQVLTYRNKIEEQKIDLIETKSREEKATELLIRNHLEIIRWLINKEATTFPFRPSRDQRDVKDVPDPEYKIN